jgi:DNA (cytosine-5)-methyltransferase 1
MGSLFDGMGVFPLAAQMCGITPVWASEIEQFAIGVTKKRFPDMQHLGDVRGIEGSKIRPVDIITFGSPCQGLSIAGKRGGLDDERSGLFIEAIRIIEEMKYETGYPRFILWENVLGALSSSGGEDFRTVLQEIAKICGKDVVIPESPVGEHGKQKWPTSGYVLGDNFSIAWRVLDAQFWGVPQRRRRVFLVADFRGHCAGKILFVRAGLSRDFAAVRRAWEGFTGPTENTSSATGESVIKIVDFGNSFGGCVCADVAPTLTENMKRESRNVPLVYDIAQRTDGIRIYENAAPTLTSFAGSGGGNVPVVESISRLRRLMPLECSRLQGMPSWWCVDTPHADKAEYAAWGNSVALPCALYIFEGLAVELFKDMSVPFESDILSIFDSFREHSYSEFRKSNIAPTLKQSGGSCGGGSEVLSVFKNIEGVE